MNWRKLVKMAIVLGGVAVAVWVWETLPESNDIVFDLTAMEVRVDSGVLRHSDVRRLVCTLENSEGVAVATITLSHVKAVSIATTVDLPPGEYAFRIELTFQRDKEAPRTHAVVHTETLSGGLVRVRL